MTNFVLNNSQFSSLFSSLDESASGEALINIYCKETENITFFNNTFFTIVGRIYGGAVSIKELTDGFINFKNNIFNMVISTLGSAIFINSPVDQINTYIEMEDITYIGDAIFYETYNSI